MAHPYFPETEIPLILEKVADVLSGKEMLSQGRAVREFEETFATYCGTKYAVATSSCSAALEIALRSLKLQPTDEVIVPVETFVATGAAVLRENAKLIFAGINPDTFCLSLSEVKRLHTENTKAVIIVHMCGLVTPEIFEIRDYCHQHNMTLIEDAAHAPGATLDGQKAGSIGDIGCFSFYPTKVITTGEGGMITTNNEKFHKLANSYRHRGRDLDAPIEQYNDLGANCRMTEISAIMGLSQLKSIEDFIDKRNQAASGYEKNLQVAHKNQWVTLLKSPHNGRHAYWRYIVRLSEQFDRNELQSIMAAKGIPVDWAYCPPLHLQPVFQKRLGTKPGDLPETENIMDHFICLPMHQFISEADTLEISTELTNTLTEMSNG